MRICALILPRVSTGSILPKVEGKYNSITVTFQKKTKKQTRATLKASVEGKN